MSRGDVAAPLYHRCSAKDPAVVCAPRREAMQKGEMVWYRATRRWLFPLEIPYTFRVPAFPWTFCPFCGGDLPGADVMDGTGGPPTGSEGWEG